MKIINYYMYKLKKIIGQLFEGLIDIIFYIPRYLYKNNEKFHKWIEENSRKSSIKRSNKRNASRIFRDLEQQHQCIVFAGWDDDHDFDFDYSDHRFEKLLSDKKWIKKNKLKVKEMTLIEYVEEYMPKRKYLVSDWQKDDLVYIITR